ncbi:hypothetical protein [Bradyrhizobium sp. SYSU BS000235]|uniref:hypothetical protein n=1 Tax=Bradyrhizobium sp. SYSU BS000235 TaxID=3411332 RepID=UPI003C7885B9
MTVSTFVPTAAGNQSVNSYTGAIDGDFSVLTRLGVAFAPHAQAIPTMTVALDAGHIFNGTDLTEVPPQTTTAITAPVTDPRIDRVVIDRLTGVVSVVTGSESAAPVAPAFPAGTVPVARVLLQPGMTVITNDAITDERSLYSLGSSGSTGGGGLLNVQVFSTPGTYTYTPTPGTNKIIVEVQGAGGNGGNASSQTNRPGCGCGGASGAYAKSFLTSGFPSVAVVVGVPGFGGSSSFGSITAPGGFGGNSGNETNPPTLPLLNYCSLPPITPVATGGNIVNASCGVGRPGFVLGLMENTAAAMCQIQGGVGAASKFGPGGDAGIVATGHRNGRDAGAPGAGGGGAIALASEPGTYLGGKGANGIVMVYEYA